MDALRQRCKYYGFNTPTALTKRIVRTRNVYVVGGTATRVLHLAIVAHGCRGRNAPAPNGRTVVGARAIDSIEAVDKDFAISANHALVNTGP